LTRPPPESYDDLPIEQEPNVDPPAFRTAVRLWSEEEGPSRLVMRLRIQQAHERDEFAFDLEILGVDVDA